MERGIMQEQLISYFEEKYKDFSAKDMMLALGDGEFLKKENLTSEQCEFLYDYYTEKNVTGMLLQKPITELEYNFETALKNLTSDGLKEDVVYKSGLFSVKVYKQFYELWHEDEPRPIILLSKCNNSLLVDLGSIGRRNLNYTKYKKSIFKKYLNLEIQKSGDHRGTSKFIFGCNKFPYKRDSRSSLYTLFQRNHSGMPILNPFFDITYDFSDSQTNKITLCSLEDSVESVKILKNKVIVLTEKAKAITLYKKPIECARLCCIDKKNLLLYIFSNKGEELCLK